MIKTLSAITFIAGLLMIDPVDPSYPMSILIVLALSIFTVAATPQLFVEFKRQHKGVGDYVVICNQLFVTLLVYSLIAYLFFNPLLTWLLTPF